MFWHSGGVKKGRKQYPNRNMKTNSGENPASFQSSGPDVCLKTPEKTTPKTTSGILFHEGPGTPTFRKPPWFPSPPGTSSLPFFTFMSYSVSILAIMSVSEVPTCWRFSLLLESLPTVSKGPVFIQ